MEKELVIYTSPTEVQIALLEDKKLVELHSQKTNSNFSVGDIFLGRIQKLNPGMNAAFVDIGHKKDAFLHYTDLSPKLRSLQKFTNGAVSGGITKPVLDDFKIEADIPKLGKVSEVLQKKQFVLVQIMKEPIASKGHRLSCEITLPGRFMVLTPFTNGVSVSKKIANPEERKRLVRLGESLKPKNFGMIIRTAAEGAKVADLNEEMRALVSKWEQIHRQMLNASGPKLILSELDKTSSILRDLLNNSFTRIHVDSKEMALDIKTFIQRIAPDKTDIVKVAPAGKPIFEQLGVTRQIKAAFGKTATMASGAYIVIEHTEALHVIDVNSGHKTSSIDQENNAFSVNLEAAEEIARQLRLRDIGGIIIVDFIDMKDQEHRKDIYEKMRDFMKRDAAKHTVLPLSKFGLLQITRQRVRPEINITTSEDCPACGGTGKVNSSILVTDNVVRDLDFILLNQPPKSLKLTLHPFLQAYFTQGFPSMRMRWFMKYKKWVTIKSSLDLGLTDYKFYDEHDEEIKLD